jgi:hypothetical protein
VLLDVTGAEKAELHAREHKSIQTDRVQLRPGPEKDTRDCPVDLRPVPRPRPTGAGRSQRHSMRRAFRPTSAGPGRAARVHQILTNEKYIGNNVYNRRSFKLKRKRVANPPEMWIRRNGAFAGIVSVDRFEHVQQLIAERSRRFTATKSYWPTCVCCWNASATSLGCSLMKLTAWRQVPSTGIASRVSCGPYQLVGYTPDRDYEFLETNRRLRQFPLRDCYVHNRSVACSRRHSSGRSCNRVAGHQ